MCGAARVCWLLLVPRVTHTTTRHLQGNRELRAVMERPNCWRNFVVTVQLTLAGVLLFLEWWAS